MNKQTKNIALSAAFSIVVLIFTAYFPRVPLAFGYVHIGDVFVYLSAAILPFPYSFLGAALGATLADVLTGYAVYAPFTFFIKAFMALLLTNKNEKIVCKTNILGIVLGAIITTAGYFIADLLLYGFAASLLTIIPNLMQGVVSSILFILLAFAFDKTNVKKRLR